MSQTVQNPTQKSSNLSLHVDISTLYRDATNISNKNVKAETAQSTERNEPTIPIVSIVYYILAHKNICNFSHI